MKVQITLKSGAQVVFAADDIRAYQSADGGIERLGWADNLADPAAPRLLEIDRREIAAIVTQTTEGET